MADSSVFDFPDPTPNFDFDSPTSSFGNGPSSTNNNNSNSKMVTSPSKKKGGGGLKGFKSRFSSKNKSTTTTTATTANNTTTPSSPPGSPLSSPNSLLNMSTGDASGATATTASMSVLSSVGNGSSSHGSSGVYNTPNRPSSPSFHQGNNHNNNNSSPYANYYHGSSPPSSRGNSPSPIPRGMGGASPSTTSGRARTPSPNNFEFTFDDASPKSSSSLRKHFMGGGGANNINNKSNPNPYLNLGNGNRNNNASPDPYHMYNNNNHYMMNNMNNHNMNNNHMSSDRTAASGYISEVSEFSFDRVTVTTERTGMSSNVSWNFLDGSTSGDRGHGYGGGLLSELGVGQERIVPSNGGGVGVGGMGGKQYQPPDIDKLLLDEDLLSGSNSNGSHQLDVFTGEIHERCDISVISDISQGIDEPRDHKGSNMDFINSLLVEKYDNSGSVVYDDATKQQQQVKDKGVVSTPSSTARKMKGSGGGGSVLSGGSRVGTSKTKGSGSVTGGGGSTHASQQRFFKGGNNTISTVSSSASTAFSAVEGAYDKFKQRNAARKSPSRSSSNKNMEEKTLLQSIMEEIQFCGMYICGFDTTVPQDPDDGQLTDRQHRGVDIGMSKDDRMKEMESTFLGKVIRCTPCCGKDTTVASEVGVGDKGDLV